MSNRKADEKHHMSSSSLTNDRSYIRNLSNRKTSISRKVPITRTLEDPSNFVAKDGTKLVQAPLFLLVWQKEICLSIIAICFACLLSPSLRPYAEPFIFLSYKQPDGSYGKGPKDACFPIFWVIVFTAFRVIVMDYVFRPFVLNWGVRNRKVIIRFCEQGYSFFYYLCFWFLGLYIYRSSNYWSNEEKLFEDYPQYYMSPLFKAYYLIQLGFWLQQILVLHLEQRRADHWQMFAHHIVTCALIILSYGFNFLRVGNAILYIFDLSDYILSGGKMLKYLGFGKICDYLFGIFVASWVYSRHYLFSKILRVVVTNAPEIIGGFHLDVPNGYIFNKPIYIAFIILLFTLQLLIYIWFGMIVKVAYRVFSGEEATDSRSDDEGGRRGGEFNE
nr:longevity assurance factor [Schizosaccharomyces pombe]